MRGQPWEVPKMDPYGQWFHQSLLPHETPVKTLNLGCAFLVSNNLCHV